MNAGIVRVQIDVDKNKEPKNVLPYVQADYATYVSATCIICHMQKEDLEYVQQTLKYRVCVLNSVK